MCGWLKPTQSDFTIFIKVIFLEDHMDIVEVKNICKTYQAFQMKDVSFSLEEGRITGFIGRNGAGKSTTIKAMLNETVINPPAELGRLTDARCGERSNR